MNHSAYLYDLNTLRNQSLGILEVIFDFVASDAIQSSFAVDLRKSEHRIVFIRNQKMDSEIEILSASTRLEYRRWRLSDAQTVLDIFRKPEVSQYLGSPMKDLEGSNILIDLTSVTSGMYINRNPFEFTI